jgi:hypothetical protein
MNVRRVGAAVLTLAAACAAVTGCADEPPGGVRHAAALADDAVVTTLRAPRVQGRLVYDPPPDLSLANAQARRPDLFPRDPGATGTGAAAVRAGGPPGAPPVGAQEEGQSQRRGERAAARDVRPGATDTTVRRPGAGGARGDTGAARR